MERRRKRRRKRRRRRGRQWDEAEEKMLGRTWRGFTTNSILPHLFVISK